MSLPSDELDAFLRVAQEKSFSRAARLLFVTQSAVSQRIAKLEKRLSTRLFIRGPQQSLRLTRFGEDMLRYCETRARLEDDLLQLAPDAEGHRHLTGAIRVAGYSSVSRSILLPSLAPLLERHPQLQLDLRSAELRELPDMLRQGEVDFIVMQERVLRPGFESFCLGEETHVLIEASGADGQGSVHTYLDHDPEDTTTESFRQLQPETGKLPPGKRHYLDDIYGILDGVESGLGRAVMSVHLLRPHHKVRVLKQCVPLRIPVWLHTRRQDWYTALHAAVVRQFKEHVPDRLQCNHHLLDPSSIKKSALVSPRPVPVELQSSPDCL